MGYLTVDFLSILRVGSEGTDGLPGSAFPFASLLSFVRNRSSCFSGLGGLG